MAKVCLLLSMSLPFSFLLGCSDSLRLPPAYEVTGTVTFNGVPLASGEITFDSEQPDGLASANGPISEGQYKVKCRAGVKKVSILSFKEIPGQRHSTGEPVKDQIIPPQYNVATTLTVEVKANGVNSFDFQLRE